MKRSLYRVNKKCTCPFCKKVCTKDVECEHLHFINKRRQEIEPSGHFGMGKYRYIYEFEFIQE